MPTGSKLVASFLSAYDSREPPFPKLQLKLTTYDEINRHKYYRIDCTISISAEEDEPSMDVSWRQQRRLCTLREDLHDVTKALLGEEKYKVLFHPNYKFASHGGFVPGTVGRLTAWCDRLAEVINLGKVPTKVVEIVLSFWMNPSFTPQELAGLPNLPWCEQKAELKLDAEAGGPIKPVGALRTSATEGKNGLLLQPLPLFTQNQEDRPGSYEILEETMVNTVADYTSPLAAEVTRLSVGTIVNVTEVMRREELKRVRARIAKPEGWISLLDIGDGFRWAKPVDN